MKNRITGIIIAAALALAGSLAARAESLCGQRINEAKHQTVISCVDWDKLRALVPMIQLSGVEMQALVDPADQAALAVRVTFRRGGETVSILSDLYMQPDGRRRANVRIPGADWTAVEVKVWVE